MELIQISPSLLITVVAPLCALLGVVLTLFFTKNLTRAQKESIIIQDYEKYSNALLSRLDAAEKKIAKLEGGIKKADEDRDVCKLEYALINLELNYMKKKEAFLHVERTKVFVIDDDKEDLEEFRKIFDKSAVLEFSGFTRAEDFLREGKIWKPPCVVIDMHLIETTGDKVVKLIEWESEKFVISGESGYEKRFLDNPRVRFYHKEGRYVSTIAMDVIKYLTDKIKL